MATSRYELIVYIAECFSPCIKKDGTESFSKVGHAWIGLKDTQTGLNENYGLHSSVDDENNLPGVIDKETLKLFKWSLVTAQNADSYRDVTVKVITADQDFRTIHFPNAFIIDYNERYFDSSGMGEFSLVLRQKADKFTDVQAE
ncbi:Hypothetical protein LUCI_3051 [Lucifera butyrica]|uniref:Uncharacterized protein n=1 Tax=Lucifera butyrica TaxID=1351585 RepID=A0A498R507_9FIRM|nr:hypothetical protein [Lucifera butyrica]VBB07786.1 Hypothetical protein LUCI_3051 [Lucifera butyrica]